MPFSTRDEDHDNFENYGCAVKYQAGWWYNKCLESNLNGKYYKEPKSLRANRGIQWQSWKGSYYSLQSVNMKMRPAGFRLGEDSAESDIYVRQH